MKSNKYPFIEQLVRQMTIEEKVAQLSCTTSVAIVRNSKLCPELLAPFQGVGLGRITQFGTPFYDGPLAAAKAYNELQRFLIENTRLGIPALIQMEVIGGPLVKEGTNFPAPISIASSFRPELAQKMAEESRRQCMSIGVRKALGPDLDIARDPRWGRTIETFGEDVYLTSQFGKHYVKGLQGDWYGHNVVSCGKHFLGFSAAEASLHSGYVALGEKELFETYASPFAACIQDSDMQSVMVTYSEVDGLPVTVNQHILKDILVDRLEFTGSALCDGGSIEKAYHEQGIGETMADVAKMALMAGIDVDSPITDAYHSLPELIRCGKLEEKYLDEAVFRVLRQKYDLGLFEDPFVDEALVADAFDSERSRTLAYDIAKDSIILLKNNGILPLSEKAPKLAVIGPHANSRRSFFYGYSYASHVEMLMSIANNQNTTMDGISAFYSKIMSKEDIKHSLGMKDGQTTREAIEEYLKVSAHCKTLYEAICGISPHTLCEKGCDISCGTEEELQKAIAAASQSDVIILALGGLNGWSEYATSGEGRSRGNLDLPAVQQRLLKEIKKTGKPIILVLFNGRAMTIHDGAQQCDAILETWVNGPQGASVIAEAIFGRINPSGKLPVTIPRSVGQIPIYYSHKKCSGYVTETSPISLRDQVRSDSTIPGHVPYPYSVPSIGAFNDSLHVPLYPFGFGLSYTTFRLFDFYVDPSVRIPDHFHVTLKIKNTGDCAGSEVIQIYYHDNRASVVRPTRQMIGFYKADLECGECKEITFCISTKQLGFLNEANQYIVEPGSARIDIATSSADIYFSSTIIFTGSTQDILHDRVHSCTVTETTLVC